MGEGLTSNVCCSHSDAAVAEPRTSTPIMVSEHGTALHACACACTLGGI